MPYLDETLPASENGKTWQKFFRNGINRGIQARRIDTALSQMREAHPLRSAEIAYILMGFRAKNGFNDHPILFGYAIACIKAGIITAGDLLLAVLKRSCYGSLKTQSPDKMSRRNGHPSTEERMLVKLVLHYQKEDLPTSPLELQSLIHALWRWLKIISEYEMKKQLEGAGLHTVDWYIFGFYETLGYFAITILNKESMRAISDKKWWKEKRAAVVAEMTTYDEHVLQWMQSQLAGKLRLLTSMPPFIELDKKGRPIFTDQQILDAISEVPMVQSRAGLFIWLNAALIGRPLTDDMAILSFLHARYPGNMQSLIVDLLAASFDVLTNAILRKESPQNVKVIRSFLCNKVPLLLSTLVASSATAASPEPWIQMALMPAGMISMDVLPPITPGATEARDNLKHARLDFLQACALHGLVSESTVSAIIQENVALPRVQKLNKNALLAQCSNNASRLESLVEDLDAMQGNAGAIAQCVVEHLSSLCLHKDTMALKAVCNILVKKIPRMDIVMQYVQPSTLLVPLCALLNEWVHDQEQAEFTPSYEEFASILLLTLAMIHRYDLHPSELGLMADSFLSRLLNNMSVAKPVSELSADQGAQLSKWIESLFAVDEHGEASGISDDVMRHCSPQAFYQLVPTLFEQTVFACQANCLPLKTLKGGLELLVEPFLLPSLVLGLNWMAKHSWEDHNNGDLLLQILEKLIKPSSSSPDTRAMHTTIMFMVATPLFDSLQDLLRKQPEKKKAKELSDALKPYIGQQRSLTCLKAELDEWIDTNGSITGRIKSTFRDLVNWAATPSSEPNPPPRYSFKQFSVACQVLDTAVVLDALVHELTQSLNMPVALDVATSLVCAPTPASAGQQQSSSYRNPTSKLRDSIRLIGSNVQSLLEKKQSEAEALVRLGRRVEAQLSVTQLPPIAISSAMQDQQTADQIMQDMGIDMSGTGTGANVDANMEQNATMAGLDQALDLTTATDHDLASIAQPDGMDIDQNQMFGDLNLDMSQAQQDNQQMNMQNQDDDIFAGLDMGGDMNDLDDFTFS